MTEPRPRRSKKKVLIAVAAVLVVLIAAGVLALDRVLLSQARKQAAALSQDVGRTIAIEGISTKLLGGLGVKVTGLSIGPGPGEEVPLLELPRAEVEASLLRAVRTGGKEIEIGEAVIEGLRVNVVKLPDGSTNVERFAQRLEDRQAREAPPEPAEEKAAEPPKLEIGRAAVENARIAFLDRTVKGAKELFVQDLDAEVRDLEVGKPLELVLKAAVLAEAQNLEVRVKAAPLPATLVPTPEELTLKVQPIALDPLAPFLPESVGLRGGRFEADLTAALGAAVPGGEGKTRVKGGFKATQLAFAGQAGGKRLDASLDADLEADAAAGDLRIGKLVVTAGPAVITGQGRAMGLAGDSPRVEGLEITSRGLDPSQLAEYYPPLRKQLGGAVIAGPIGLSLRGDGSQERQRVELRVDLGPVRLVVPRQLAKAAGAPLLLTARADAAQGGGRVRFDGDLDLAGVDLRPGGAVAKQPGDPLSVKVAGTYRRAGEAQEIDLSSVGLDLLGDRLSGKGQVTVAGRAPRRTTRFEASLEGARLDLDRLLVAEPAEKKEDRKKKEPSKPLDPKAFAGLSGEANLRLGLLRAEGVDMRNVIAKVKVQEDAITLEQAQLQAFGGSVSASGTFVKLAHPDEPFKIVTNVKNVAGEQLLGLFSKQKVLSGTLDAGLELGGSGMKRGELLKSVTGDLEGTLRGGAFHGKDLVASVATPLAGMLPFAKGKVTEGGATSLGKELPFAFQIADGAARLKNPLRWDAGQAIVAVEGGVKLDGTLEMPATLGLSPELVSRITGGRARPKEPIPVSFRLSGPAWKPRLEGLSLEPAAKAIASEAAAGALGRALGSGGGSAGEVADKKKEEAKARADQEAEDARRKLEEEARKRLKGIFGE
jgi:AsmA protein